MSLHEIHIQGFKSIQDQKLLFGHLNVFIGGNGSGKSNLVGVFHFLNRIANQQLQTYTGEAGGANALLHFGRKRTGKMGLRIEFETRPNMSNIFEFELKPTDQDRFIFEKEATYF